MLEKTFCWGSKQSSTQAKHSLQAFVTIQEKLNCRCLQSLTTYCLNLAGIECEFRSVLHTLLMAVLCEHMQFCVTSYISVPSRPHRAHLVGRGSGGG